MTLPKRLNALLLGVHQSGQSDPAGLRNALAGELLSDLEITARHPDCHPAHRLHEWMTPHFPLVRKRRYCQRRASR